MKGSVVNWSHYRMTTTKSQGMLIKTTLTEKPTFYGRVEFAEYSKHSAVIKQLIEKKERDHCSAPTTPQRRRRSIKIDKAMAAFRVRNNF